jgi:hypothetical protein
MAGRILDNQDGTKCKMFLCLPVDVNLSESWSWLQQNRRLHTTPVEASVNPTFCSCFPFLHRMTTMTSSTGQFHTNAMRIVPVDRLHSGSHLLCSIYLIVIDLPSLCKYGVLCGSGLRQTDCPYYLGPRKPWYVWTVRMAEVYSAFLLATLR